GALAPVAERFQGVVGAVLNQPRTATLVAAGGPDGGCRMLLIKRKSLLEIIQARRDFFQDQLDAFIRRSLPERLSANHLFREALFREDVRDEDWPRLVELLRGAGPAGPGLARVRSCLGA